MSLIIKIFQYKLYLKEILGFFENFQKYLKIHQKKRYENDNLFNYNKKQMLLKTNFVYC